jgi:hypothetical protein
MTNPRPSSNSTLAKLPPACFFVRFAVFRMSAFPRVGLSGTPGSDWCLGVSSVQFEE